MQYYIAPPPMNPLSRLLAGILAVLALVGALFFGVFILIFAVGLGLVLWLALWIRMWWVRRTLARSGAGRGPATPNDPFASSQSERQPRPPGASQKGDVIDAEYTVVSRRDED